MKYLFTLLLTSFLSFGQNRLSVHIRSCKGFESSIEQFNEFELYRNDSLIEISKTNILGFKQYEDIPEGNYHIIANTFFGKRKSEIIPVKKIVNADSFVICVDELNESIVNSSSSIIDNLTNNEEIKLSYYFGGCFSSGKYEVTILQKNDHLYIKYNSKTKKLKKKQIEILKQFLIEFANLKNIADNCISTSSSSIELSHQNKKKSFSFSCYRWAGFQNLEKDLKIEIKKEPLNKNTN